MSYDRDEHISPEEWAENAYTWAAAHGKRLDPAKVADESIRSNRPYPEKYAEEHGEPLDELTVVCPPVERGNE